MRKFDIDVGPELHKLIGQLAHFKGYGDVSGLLAEHNVASRAFTGQRLGPLYSKIYKNRHMMHEITKAAYKLVPRLGDFNSPGNTLTFKVGMGAGDAKADMIALFCYPHTYDILTTAPLGAGLSTRLYVIYKDSEMEGRAIVSNVAGKLYPALQMIRNLGS